MHPTQQAQERGEIMMLHDDAVYFYDGLAPTKPLGTRREAAVRLSEMMATARGRAALRWGWLAVYCMLCTLVA